METQISESTTSESPQENRRRIRRAARLGYAGVALLAIIAGMWIHAGTAAALESALREFRTESHTAAADTAKSVAGDMRLMYEGLRTMARLPGVRSIDRYARAFDENSRRTVQEIYNNLASSVAVSEVYIVPIDMHPDEKDPNTGKLQEPITTFDQLIVGRTANENSEDGGQGDKEEAEEIEIFEYRLMRQQMDWLAARYPEESTIQGLEYPAICGPEVITCDNSRFDTAHPDDADRSGIVYSVPFYSPGGALRGMVSAVMLTHALRDKLAGNGEWALRCADHQHTVLPVETGAARQFKTNVEAGTPTPSLPYCETLSLPVADADARWTLWAGRTEETFNARSDVRAAYRAGWWGYAAVGVAALAVLAVVRMVERAMVAGSRRDEDLIRLVNERTSELSKQSEALERLALSDKLTGLPNRALLLDRLTQAQLRATRSQNRSYAVLFLDFDRFKLINDTMGHDAGDELLRQIATRLRREIRSTDSASRVVEGNTAARLGGDEFVVLLEDLAAPDDAARVAERLVQVFSEPYHIAGQRVISTASIGVAIGDPNCRNPDSVLADADVAMYEAKAAGKGRYVMFDEAMRQRVLRRAELERDIALAIEFDQLSLLYQPVVSLATREVRSVEALLRWQHPAHGSISPAEFVPIAEESGSIGAITQWVAQTACTQLFKWRSTLGPIAPQTVAINLSRRDLAEDHIVERLVRAARSAGLETSSVCLEVTETAMMRDKKTSLARIKALKAAGFRVALDDFGTGHSSLASLHEIPLDAVKMDRAFITHVGMGREYLAMMSAVVTLASNLKMSVVAEGVEYPDQAAALQAVDCEFAQGYLFGKAMTAADLEGMLRRPISLAA